MPDRPIPPDSLTPEGEPDPRPPDQRRKHQRGNRGTGGLQPGGAGAVSGDDRCSAKNRQGNQCGHPVVPGRRVCRYHGGLTPRGALSPNYKHGKYTEVIPHRMMQWYLEFRRDPNLMDMTDDIGLLQARQKEILGGLSTGEAGASWRRMAELIQALKTAMSARDSEGIVSALTQLETLARNGASDVQVWNEYMNVGEKKRRLVDTERKRRMDMKVMLAPEQLMAILKGYTQIVMEETSPDDLDRIARRMFALSQRVKAGDLDAAMSPQ